MTQTQLYESADLFARNNAHTIRHKFKTDNTAGAEVAATGLTVTGFLSATKTGSAIDPTLSVTLTEYAGAPGFYAGTLAGAALLAQLIPTYTDTTIWEVVTVGTSYRAERPVIVRDERLPEGV